MSFCSNCGVKLAEGVTTCPNCGQTASAFVSPTPKLDVFIRIFMIVGCVLEGWLIIPLLWKIPMTVSIFRSLDRGRPISNGMRVCTLLFASVVAGILLLCRDDFPTVTQ